MKIQKNNIELTIIRRLNHAKNLIFNVIVILNNNIFDIYAVNK